jgi:hypothetical protein
VKAIKYGKLVRDRCALQGIDRDELEELRRRKAAERRDFRGRVILDEVR